MGFGDYNIQQGNGRKEKLGEVKHGVRKDQLDSKYQALFDAYDTNKDGTLETEELDGIFKGLQSFAGSDRVLDANENAQVKSIFAEQVNIKDVDFQGFVKSVSDASAEILSSSEKQTPDGGKEVTTTYNDGTTETIAFYSNGDYKWKKTEKRTLETSFELIIDGKKYKFNDEAKFKKALEKADQKNISNAMQNAQNKQKASQSTDGISKYIKLPVSTINTNTYSQENIDRKELYSPRFIAEALGVNIATEDGKKVVERLSQLPQETLEKLKDGKELKELISSQELEPTFDNISNILEITEGVTLRNEEEYKAAENQRQEILTQIKTANFMANVYETLASYNDQYTDSVGLFGLGSEGIGYVLNKLGLDGENHYQFADSCREWAKNASELKVLNPQKFKEGFKKIYGENADKWGIDYNSDAFKKCFAIAESGKAYDKDNKMTDEYKEAILKAMNIVADDPNDSTFNQVMNGFGEALIMIATLGWGAETKAGATLATTTMSTFSKAGVAIASKQVNNKLLQGALRFSGQAVKLVGPALNEGTKMYLYTAAEGTLTNVSNRAIKQDSFDKLLDTQAQVMTNANGSFTFGAFAGVFGSTVTQKVMQRASKVASKVTTALSEKISQGAVNANEVFATIMEKSAPTKIAEAAAFATDVVGFTAFESAFTIANTLQREGTLTPEKLADTLMEEFGHQGYSLGQIKVISHLIMMLTGSRSARMQSQKYLQENLPQLKGATVEGVNGGKEGFKINLPDGRRIECKNASEMISSLHLMVRGETAFSGKFDKSGDTLADFKNSMSKLAKQGGAKILKSKGTNPKLNYNKLFTTKMPIADGNKPRLTKEEIAKHLKDIKSEYLQKNPQLAEELLDKLANKIAKIKGLNHLNVYCFKDIEDIKKVLNNLSEENKNILDLMLETNINVESSVYADAFKIFSECDSELAPKIMKMLEDQSFYDGNIKILQTVVDLVQKYPSETAILTDDYNPFGASYFINESNTEELLKRINKCNDTEKGIVKVLRSRKNFDIGYQELQKFLDADLGLSQKQVLTLFTQNPAISYRDAMDKAISELQNAKGKPLTFDTKTAYQKGKTISKDEAREYLLKYNLTEEECNAFFRIENGEAIVQVYQILDEVGEFKNVTASQKQQIFKSFAEHLMSSSDSDIKEMVERSAKIKTALPYLNKQNFELYKQTKPEATFEEFIDNVSSDIAKIECQKTCEFVQKHTGKQLTETDLLVQGFEMFSVSDLSEAEIVNSINTLKQLGLYKDDTNILTMMTRVKKLDKIDVTPEIKEFASFLAENSAIEEGITIDIISSIQGKSSEIKQAKIEYAKKLIAEDNIQYSEISSLLNTLSSENKTILDKQLNILSKSTDNKYDLCTFATFLNTNNIEDFDLSVKLIDTLLKSKNKDSRSGLINTISDLPKNNKTENINFAITLLSKGASVSDICDILHTMNKYCDAKKQKEYMSLFLKGYDTDLASQKELYTNIVILQVADISKMNVREKLELYDKLSNIDDTAKAKLQNIGLKYESLLEKVVNSLSAKRDLVNVPQAQTKMLMQQIIANNNPKAEKILQEFDFAQYGKEGLPLKYSRQKFNENVEKLLEDLEPQDVEIILKHFGLEKGNAGFDGLPNNKPFDNNEVSANVRKIAQKVQKEIENFTVNNEVMIADKDAKEVFDGLIKGCPEFTSIVGKEQHGTHAYSVDIHTLKVLQSAMNDPLYKTLSDRDKTIMKYSILLHDLGKKGGVVDEGHASLSSDYVWSILDRYPFPSSIKDRIIDIVDNHHWFEKYNTGKANAEDVAVRCRRPEDLKIYEIFSKADFENVNPTFHLGAKSGGSTNQAEFDTYMNNKFKDIEDAVHKIYEKANLVFDTQFMHNGEQFPSQTVKIDGNNTELKVLNFSDIENGASLEKYGFAPGVTKDNARFFVHMTKPNSVLLGTPFILTSTPTFQSTWSTSMIKVSNNRTYSNREFGFIMDLPQANISEAFFENSASGCEKTLDDFKGFLFGSREFNDGKQTYDVRHYVKNNFMKEMEQLGYNLNDSEYAELTQFMFNKKYLSQIREDVKVGDKVIKASDLVSALEKSRDTLFEGGDIHSEIIPLNPKVKGMIAKVEKLEDCPPEFLKFAKEHDLPIILMKQTRDDTLDKKIK